MTPPTDGSPTDPERPSRESGRAGAGAGPGRTFVVRDPATLDVVAELPEQGGPEATLAVDAAEGAFPAWSATAPRHRSEVLARVHGLMVGDRDRLARLISRENGKSRADAVAEVSYAAEFFRWFAEEAVRPGGEYGEAPAGGARTIVTHRPAGVAALVTPWNFPAAMATRKLAPALAAGCTAVLKPAAETPMTALAIVELLREAGLPDGVVNVVTGTDAGAIVGAWLADPRVRKISFTGSTRVGRLLLRQAADRVVNASMELGGNAPLIVAEDADVARAVDATMLAKFRNGGQACTAANRIYVHAAVADRFVPALASRVRALTVGGAGSGADIGPLISPAAVARVDAAVEKALRAGARLVARAAPPDLPGHFYPPTLLDHVPRDADLVTEEIFGPVAPVLLWDDEDEVVAQANDTESGLAAYVFSRDLQRAIRLAERLEAGMVGINRGTVSDPSAPFGGMKQSGLGREGAREGLREFQETQYLSLDWPA